MTIAVLVLAAGLSRRMGAQDKLAMDLGGKALLDYAVNAALASEASDVFIVTNDESVAHTYPSAKCIPAPDAARGQGHSLKAGFKVLCGQDGLFGALVMLGDMPFITADHINALISHALDTPDLISRYSHKDIPGHPVYWPAPFFEQISRLSGDEGAQAIMKAHKAQLRVLPCDEDAVIFDVDTPDRLEVARARLTQIR